MRVASRRVYSDVMKVPIAMISIDDEQFNEHVTLEEAYRIMYEFLVAYHNRGESETGTLLADISLAKDGGSADPAQLQDFFDAFKRAKERNRS